MPPRTRLEAAGADFYTVLLRLHILATYATNFASLETYESVNFASYDLTLQNLLKSGVKVLS